MDNIVKQLSDAIRAAGERGAPLCIRGGGTKDFYGGPPRGDVLDTRAYAGVVSYEPTELVITARAGTRLTEIQETLREKGQMLAFEPPHFGPDATLGGCVATGLSGPRRAHAGAVRDFLLGVRLLDGNGAKLRFGGQVIKNVAGYDVSRLMAGALGTLGVLLEASLKVLPIPPAEATLRFEASAPDALEKMQRWGGAPLPLSATCHVDGTLYVRLSGAAAGVRAAREALGGEPVEEGGAFWESLCEQSHPFFAPVLSKEPETPLWRLSVKSTTPPLKLPGRQLMEWGGALRWLVSNADAATIRATAESAGGHATLFRATDKSPGVFHPLNPALFKIHRQLKKAFDPKGIFNPGRMYQEF